MAYCATNGNLYENGKAFELKVGIGADFKVQASGTGSFQVVGKLTQNGAEEVLMMVDLSDFSTVDTITTENVYPHESRNGKAGECPQCQDTVGRG